MIRAAPLVPLVGVSFRDGLTWQLRSSHDTHRHVFKFVVDGVGFVDGAMGVVDVAWALAIVTRSRFVEVAVSFVDVAVSFGDVAALSVTGRLGRRLGHHGRTAGFLDVAVGCVIVAINFAGIV